VGDNPSGQTGFHNSWGCDGKGFVLWDDPGTMSHTTVSTRSCVPLPNGLDPDTGETLPQSWVPTIFDNMDAADVSWHIYQGLEDGQSCPTGNDPNGAGPYTEPNCDGYGWAMCPTFADCLHTDQVNNVVPADQVLADAASGDLPNVSWVIPQQRYSQHNRFSWTEGDDWIGQVAKAVREGPDWGSTAIFVLWDDFGGFYDHVAPPNGWGIRLPLVIASPWAVRASTDRHDANLLSIDAFIEHNFGVDPMGANDAAAYDFSSAFDYDQAPNLSAFAAGQMKWRRVPPWERRLLYRTQLTYVDPDGT
jgi:phospholipase C